MMVCAMWRDQTSGGDKCKHRLVRANGKAFFYTSRILTRNPMDYWRPELLRRFGDWYLIETSVVLRLETLIAMADAAKGIIMREQR